MARKKQNLYFVTGRHAVLFFIFAIGGSVLLAFTKNINLPGELIVACSFGVMLTYAFFILIVPATRLRLDVAADNMYYLGFLYTLSSLAVAIYVDEASKVLANFGVAITCTIIGIAFRVALNQLRVDPYDVEAASRVELSSATRRVSKELDQSIKELTKFRTMSMQVMAEGYEEVQKNVDGAGKGMFASLKDTSDKNSEILVKMAEQSISAQEKLFETITLFKESNNEIVLANKSMLKQISKTSAALQDLAEKYTDTNDIEERMFHEIKTGMNSLQKEILDENQKNSNEVKSGMSELHSNILDENLKSSNYVKTEMNALQSKIIDGNNKSLNELKANMSEIHSKVIDENNKRMNELYAKRDKLLDKLDNEEPAKREEEGLFSRLTRRNS